MKLNELKFVPEYKTALKPLPGIRRAGLRESIKDVGVIHDPILWHFNEAGEMCILDGYHRLQIRDELNAGGEKIPEPRFQEIGSLSGDPISVCVEWIKKHQASRRNDTKIEDSIKAGMEAIALADAGRETAEIAKATGTTEAKVKHSKAAARAMEKIKSDNPDKAAEILADPKATARTVTEALKEIEDEKPEDAKQPKKKTTRKKAANRKSPKGMLAAFKPMRESVRKLCKTTYTASQTHGESPEYKAIVKKLGEIDILMTKWEDTSVTK